MPADLSFWSAAPPRRPPGLASAGHSRTATRHRRALRGRRRVALVVFVGAFSNWFGWFANTDSPFSGFQFCASLSRVRDGRLCVRRAAGASASRCSSSTRGCLGGSSSPTSFRRRRLVGDRDDRVGLVLLTAPCASMLGRSRTLRLLAARRRLVSRSAAVCSGSSTTATSIRSDRVVALVYVGLGDLLARSSWAVLGAFGFSWLRTTIRPTSGFGSHRFPVRVHVHFDGSGTEAALGAAADVGRRTASSSSCSRLSSHRRRTTRRRASLARTTNCA